MLFATHRAAELLALADDCLVLDAGRVVAQGAPLEVLARPKAVGVAQLVGMDNLLHLPVLRHDPDGGTTELDLGGGVVLAAPLCAAEPGSEVTIGVHAEDVMLALDRPRGISARNVLPGTVVSADPIGHEVLLAIAVGEQQLRVRVTPSAMAELELAPGSGIHALIKTTACHLLSGAPA